MHLISPAPFPQEFLKEPIFVYVPLKVYLFFCSTTKLWNEIDLAIRLCDTIGSFKRMLANYYISDYFLPFDYLLDRYCSIIHSRLRPDACALFHYHFKTGVLSSPICSCGVDKETKSQFFYFVLNMLVQEKKLLSAGARFFFFWRMVEILRLSRGEFFLTWLLSFITRRKRWIIFLRSTIY